MVEEEAGVDVIGEVDPEAVAAFVDDEAGGLCVGALVLLLAALALALFEGCIFGRDLELCADGLHHGVAPLLVLCFVFDFSLTELGDVELSFVPIDDEGELWDVAVVEAIAGDAFVLAPLGEAALVFVQAVGEHLGLGLP